MISSGKWEASSHSITCGVISPSANSRTLLRSCCCSSVNANSTTLPFPLSVFSILLLNISYTTRRPNPRGRCHCPVPLLHSLDMRRRHFLTLSAATLGGVLVYSLDRKASLLASPHKPVRIPLRFFTETEALIVAATASRIFPSDDSGPGAREAGVAIYIDRQLAGPYGRDRYRYTQPPFENAPPEFGYQGQATPREIYRDGLKSLTGFHLLPPERQDTALHQIASTHFFALLRRHTIEGMFADPIHGGNA